MALKVANMGVMGNGYKNRFRLIVIHNTQCWSFRIVTALTKGIKEGINIDGVTHKVEEITLTKKLNTNNWFTMKLVEGKNREIRKIFESLDLVVNRIIRTHYGDYSVSNMELGEFKKLVAKKILN